MKSVDDAVRDIKPVIEWYKVKLAGMSLNRYLGAGGMEMLREEIECQAPVQLATVPRWILNPERLADERETKGRNAAEVVFTVYKEEDAQLLIRRGLRFGRL